MVKTGARSACVVAQGAAAAAASAAAASAAARRGACAALASRGAELAAARSGRGLWQLLQWQAGRQTGVGAAAARRRGAPLAAARTRRSCRSRRSCMQRRAAAGRRSRAERLSSSCRGGAGGACAAMPGARDRPDLIDAVAQRAADLIRLRLGGGGRGPPAHQRRCRAPGRGPHRCHRCGWCAGEGGRGAPLCAVCALLMRLLRGAAQPLEKVPEVKNASQRARSPFLAARISPSHNRPRQPTPPDGREPQLPHR